MARDILTEVRLDGAEVERLTHAPRLGSPVVVLEPSADSGPHQWVSELRLPAERIVIAYDIEGGTLERAWVLRAQTSSVRFYALAHETFTDAVTP